MKARLAHHRPPAMRRSPRLTRTLARLGTLGLAAGLGGCSILSPIPLLEFAKGTANVTGVAVQSGSGKATDTVYHLHSTVKTVCIEYNPTAPVADVVPALQLELRKHAIESRVYQASAWNQNCPVWLRYTAYMDWGTQPYNDELRPYVNNISLTLQNERGQVLSTSNYRFDGGGFNSSKWASTRDKLGPVVTALVTGFE